MTSFAEIGNTVTMPKEVFERYTIDVANLAAKTAVTTFRNEQMKIEKLTTTQVAKEAGCTIPTVINWIKNGVGKNKIKLVATTKGERGFIISRLDLEEFKKLIA